MQFQRPFVGGDRLLGQPRVGQGVGRRLGQTGLWAGVVPVLRQLCGQQVLLRRGPRLVQPSQQVAQELPYEHRLLVPVLQQVR
ncbi:hypothetical protein SF23_07495 [Streptomyces sp. MBRL 10]|nr:hypothetical protein SF23_07495 [Streptomyces sp. MBRL 10]